MFPEFSTFRVEIKNSGFTNDSGMSFPRKASVIFTSREGHHETVVDLGHLEQKEIFDLIDKEEALNLEQCYLEEFSLADYHAEKQLGRKELVKIKSLRAGRSFFNNKSTIDFSYAAFLEGDVDFDSCYFAKSNISFHSARFLGGGLNFSNTRLPGGLFDMNGVSIPAGDLTFKNAVFGTGKKDFQDMVIGEGQKNFTNTDFGEGDVSFTNVSFGDGDVLFKVSRFGTGRIDFHFAKFREGNISFERTEFGDGWVDFRTVEFYQGRVNFNRAVFGDGDVSFEASELKKGKISFQRTVFGTGNISFELAEYDHTDISFDRTDFGKGNISFYNAKFGNLSLKSCHLDYYTDLRIAKCRHIDLSDTVVRDIIDLKPYDFRMNIDTINFSGMRLIGRIFIDWEQNQVKEMIYNQKDTDKRLKAEQFRTLKENFNTTGQYNDEDKAYLEFKRQESLAILEESLRQKPYSAIWQYPVYGFKLLVFDWAGRYATDPVRVMISMLVCYTFFSLFFVVLILFTSADIVSSVGDPDKLSLVAKSFYHSAITYLTIGYGDYYPSGSIRWLSGLEGFIGLFLMSYFTVAFVRKILR